MLALPGRISKRAVGDPQKPLRLLGILTALDFTRQRVILRYDTWQQAVDISTLPPQKLLLGEVYEFLGLAGEDSFHAFWGRRVPPEALDISLAELAECIDSLEAVKRTDN